MKSSTFGVQIILILLLLTFTYHDSLCQKTPQYTHTLGVNVFTGFIYRHSYKIGHLIDHHPVGFEIFYNKQTNGTEPWEALHNYPEVGYSLGYYDYGNDALGKTISTLAHIRFSMLKSRTPHDFKVHLGAGLGFNTNPYDHENNNTNNILGSTVTFSMQGRLIYTYNLEKWQFSIAPNLTHFSNGSIKHPNKGINIFTIDVGVARKFGDHIEFKAPTEIELDKRIKVNLAAYTGIKGNYEGSDSYGFLTLHASIDKRLTPKSGVATGFDFFYSIALKEEIKYKYQFLEEEPPDFKRFGWLLGYEYYISRLSIIAQVGIYLYRPYKDIPPAYQRLGFKYYTGKKIYLSANLKTHAAAAEFAEFGLGIKL